MGEYISMIDIHMFETLWLIIEMSPFSLLKVQFLIFNI